MLKRSLRQFDRGRRFPGTLVSQYKVQGGDVVGWILLQSSFQRRDCFVVPVVRDKEKTDGKVLSGGEVLGRSGKRLGRSAFRRETGAQECQINFIRMRIEGIGLTIRLRSTC